MTLGEFRKQLELNPHKYYYVAGIRKDKDREIEVILLDTSYWNVSSKYDKRFVRYYQLVNGEWEVWI